jgi:hypothetical protein
VLGMGTVLDDSSLISRGSSLPPAVPPHNSTRVLVLKFREKLAHIEASRVCSRPHSHFPHQVRHADLDDRARMPAKSGKWLGGRDSNLRRLGGVSLLPKS